MEKFQPNLALPVQTQRDTVDIINEIIKEVNGVGDDVDKAAASAAAAQEAAEAAAAAAQEAAGAFAIKSTATGAVIQINDAAEGLDPVQLITTVTPVQYGEGYPTPTNIRPIAPVSVVTLDRESAAGDVTTLTADIGQMCYGGTMEWETGVFTLTHEVIVFDGTEDWKMNNTVGNAVRLTTPAGAAAAALCSHYRCRSITPAYVDTAVSIATQLNFKDPVNAVDVDTWKAYLVQQHAAGTPVTLVVELTTPSEITLTAQQLTMLQQQTITTTGGETTVRYVVDLRAYINNAIDERMG